MRKLIVNRKKAIAGCAGKVLIYSIDKIDKNIGINKEDCNFLGYLKNNSVLEIEIPKTEITIFAAYDSFGVFEITDYLVIPQGAEDVVISGKTKLNPLRGNPFIFERNN